MNIGAKKIVRIMGLTFVLAVGGPIAMGPAVSGAAFAKNGQGQGQGQGKAQGRKATQGGQKASGDTARQRGNSAQTGRKAGNGALASELKWLNAAHANPRALANAAPNSMPGKLHMFREAYQFVGAAREAAALSGEEYARLQALMPGKTSDGESEEAARLRAAREARLIAAYYTGENLPQEGQEGYSEDAYKAAYQAALEEAFKAYQAELEAARLAAEGDAQKVAARLREREEAYQTLLNGLDLSDEAYGELLAMLGLPPEE